MSEVEPEEAEKYRIISTIFLLISYTFVLLLYISSMYFLLRTPSVTNTHMRRFLPIFASIVFTISTVSLVLGLLLDFVYPIAFFSSPPNSINDTLCSLCNCKSLQIVQNFFMILAIWAADGFMIWRCKVLYYTLTCTKRILFLSFCWLMVILSFVIGILYIIPSTRSCVTLTFLSCVTLIVNISITTLIVGRFIGHRKYVKSLGPGHDLASAQIIALCSFESAILVVVFNLIFVVFSFLRSGWSLILIPTLVQVYAIDPLMTIYRIARNRNKRSRAESIPTAIFTHSEPTPNARQDLKALEFSKSMTSTLPSMTSIMDVFAEKTNPFENTQYSCSESPNEVNPFHHSTDV